MTQFIHFHALCLQCGEVRRSTNIFFCKIDKALKSFVVSYDYHAVCISSQVNTEKIYLWIPESEILEYVYMQIHTCILEFTVVSVLLIKLVRRRVMKKQEPDP